MYLLHPLSSLTLMDVGSASTCPKWVAKLDGVCPAVDLTVATDNVDDAEDVELLPSLDCLAEEELLAMLEAALLAISMSLILLDLIPSITRPRRSTVYNRHERHHGC
jgi:hypothetical protein